MPATVSGHKGKRSRTYLSQPGSLKPAGKDTTPVDNKTRQKLKQNNFVETTKHGLQWAGENRRSVITTSILILAMIVLGVGGVALYNYRSNAAAAQFSAGMEVYSSPITTPGEPVTPGAQTYATALDRATAANTIFVRRGRQVRHDRPRPQRTLLCRADRDRDGPDRHCREPR